MRTILAAVFLLLSANAAALENNTWTLIEPQPCVGDLCVGDYPHFRAYSGTAMGDGKIWWWGGGHKAGPYNSVDAYDLSENRWHQMTTAEDITNTREWDHLTAEQQEKQMNTWGGGRGPMYWSPLGRFMTHHSYAWQLWNPKREKFCGLFPYPPEQYPVYACYDPAKGDASGEPASSGTDPSQPDGAFQIISRTVPDWGSARHTVGLTWDTKRQQVVMVNASGRDGIWRYDAAADSWDRVSDSLLKPVESGSYAEGYIDYHPGMDAYFTNRKRQLNLVDADTGKAQRITNPPTHLLTFSLEYSPELGRMLFADNGDNSVAEVYAYDPAADAWDKLNLGGQVPTESTFGYDLFDRSPETGQYYLINKASDWQRNPGVYTVSITEAALTKDNQKACPVDACVGDAYQYASVQSAIDAAPSGGTVGLEGRDFTQSAVISKPLTLKSLSGRAHLRDKVYDTKGIVVVNNPEGTVTVEGIEFSGADDTKAIWHSAANLTLRDVIVHDSGMGVLAGPDANTTKVINSEFYGMADPNEKAHFIYGGESQKLVVRDTYLHGGTDGHFIKAKSVNTLLDGNRIEQETYTDINLIDVWACGENVVTNNHMESVNIDDYVNAIGITKRTSEAEPCPAPTTTFRAEGNTYIKHGEALWSRFVDNRWTSDLPVENVTLANNDVTNATYYRDKNRQLETEADWIAFSGEQATTEPDSGQMTLTGGMYHVVVNGEVVSDHFQLKEAVQQAVNALLANDQATVTITRDPSRVEMK